jgi:hypothetical protein
LLSGKRPWALWLAHHQAHQCGCETINADPDATRRKVAFIQILMSNAHLIIQPPTS